MSNHYRDKVDTAARALGFTFLGYDGRGHLVWEHPRGRVSTPATPSEWRGAKNAIAQLERAAGTKLPRPNHRRGRKPAAPAVDPQVEASRRKHAETYDEKCAERERQKAQAAAAAAADRRRREIEELMRP